MKGNLNSIIEKLGSASWGDVNYVEAKTSLINIFKKAHDCSFEQAKQAIDEADERDVLMSSTTHLLGLAKGLTSLEEADSSNKTMLSKVQKADPRRVLVAIRNKIN